MLNISPLLLTTTVIIFLVSMYILNKILYKPLLDFMKNRDESIAIDYENASKNSDDVSIYLDEAKQIIKDAKTEASSLRSLAIEEAKEYAQKKTDERKSELEEEYTVFLKGLNSERVEFKNGLLAQMPLYKEGIKAKLNQI